MRDTHSWLYIGWIYISPAVHYSIWYDSCVAGVRVVWDGWSYTEVEVPLVLRNLTCGLCGNFNGNSTDDLTTRGGRLVRKADRMAASWSVGRARQCRRRIMASHSSEELIRNRTSGENEHSPSDSPARARPARSCRASHSRAMMQCGLLNATVFLPCHSVVPVDMFYEWESKLFLIVLLYMYRVHH